MKTCKNCNKEFSNYIVIDGNKCWLYHRKFCTDCSPYKSHNTKDITKSPITEIEGKIYKVCNICKENLELNKENYYFRSRGDYHTQCKKCSHIQTIQKNRELKKRCIEYKGGKCQVCGYNKYGGSLHFHHVDATKKDFQISQNKTYDFEKLKIELDKCILVCSNCHGEIHGGLITIS